ncbi:MAG: CHASE domain-containing protein, partial [Nitrospirota bacterium]|nr:CHASE domain-containing protein [Nitrospirota bacterium]
MKQKYSLFTFLPAVVVILLTIAAYAYLSHHERKNISGKFQSLCSDYTARVTLALDHVTDLTAALVGFYDGSKEVTQQEFQDFVRRIKEPDDGILNFSWAPHVLAKDRARYESSARAAGHTSFEFTERKSTGQFVAVESRPEYFPAYFIEPLSGSEAALGFDNASEPHRRQAMERARDNGETTATEPVRLVQENGGSAGVLLFSPVYTKGTEIRTPEDRQTRLMGFVACVLRVDDMVRYAEKGFAKNDLVVRLEDMDAPDDQRLLYVNTGSANSTASRQSAELHWEGIIQIADRSWRLTLQPTDHFLVSEGSLAPLLVLIAGVIVATLVQLVILTMRNREAEVRQLVDERTDELKKEKEFSETIINTLSGIFYLIDKDGRFVRWNRKLEEVTEYSADEIARMHPLDFFEGATKSYIAARIEEVFRTGESFAEADLFTKSGKNIPFYLTGARLVTADGEFLTGM